MGSAERLVPGTTRPAPRGAQAPPRGDPQRGLGAQAPTAVTEATLSHPGIPKSRRLTELLGTLVTHQGALCTMDGRPHVIWEGGVGPISFTPVLLFEDLTGGSRT